MYSLSDSLLRHRGKALFASVATLIVVLVALALWPRKYQSEGKLFVRLGRESVSIGPTITSDQTVQVSDTREHEVNSVSDMLGSRVLAEKVVDQLGPAVVLGYGDGSSSSGWIGSSIGGAKSLAVRLLEPTGAVSDREAAIVAFRKSLRVTPPRRSNVITVEYRDDDAERAQQILSTLMDAYVEEHVNFHRMPSSQTFFVEQQELFERQWTAASEELREAKNEMQLASLDGQRTLIESRISTITSRLIESRAELSAAEAQRLANQKALDELPERVTTAEVGNVANQAGDFMRDRLYALELEEKDLSARYSPDHPRVLATRRKLEEGRAIMAQQDEGRTETTSGINPAWQAEELQLLQGTARARALTAEIEALTQQHEQALADLATLNENVARIESLTREVELAEVNFRTYAQKLEEARIARELEDQRISNINIAQAATLVEKPVSPQKGVVIALGLILAAVVGGTTPLVAERFGGKDPTSRQAQTSRDVPVLADIPPTATNELLKV